MEAGFRKQLADNYNMLAIVLTFQRSREAHVDGLKRRDVVMGQMFVYFKSNLGLETDKEVLVSQSNWEVR